MDRKGIIAVTAAILVLLIWQVKFAPKFMPPTPPPGQTASGSPAPTAGATAAPETVAPVVSAAPSATPAEATVPEQITDASGPAARYQFTNHGGGISRTELTGYAAESGSDVALNEFGTLPIGAISEQPAQGADLPYTVTLQGSNTVLCVRNQPGGLSISKKFILPASTKDAHGYRLLLDVSFANHGAQAVQSGGYYLSVGSAVPIHQRDSTIYTDFDWFVQGGKDTQINVTWFNAGKIPLITDLTGFGARPERPVYTVDADKIGWAAVSSQFFTTVAAPENGATGTGVWAHQFPVKTGSRDVLAVEGALRLPAFSLKPGESVSQSVEIYAGPKIYNALKGLGDGQEHILNFGMFAPITIFLLSTMNWLHSWTGSYAVAIIILTLTIRGILWPIQNRATASMRQMQELQPRMTELKEKYKDDPARMNTEVMKLYKQYNVNPLAGCLPMFIQMPIFIGFYRMLGTAIELRGSKFLWVHDLSQPDSPFHAAPLAWIHVLPIFMAVTMIAQMSMTPKSGDKSQQQMFLIMPLIFIVFCYNYASALALYMSVGNIFSIVQLYVTRARTAPAPFKALAKRKTR